MRPVSPYVSRVLSAFAGGARETPSGWDARCPSPTHGSDGEDRRPSLRLSIGEGGVVLVTCRVGCTTQSVLDAAGLKYSDLFCPPGESPMEPLTSASAPTSEEDLGLRDRVYRSLLRRLALAPDDARQLEAERGLDARQCELRGYKTLGLLESRKLPQSLWEEFGDDLYLVPGFTKLASGVAALHCNTSLVGVVVPVRSHCGRVVGLKTRRRGDSSPKYMAWSSPDASCGVLVHCAMLTEQEHDRSFVRVTEGEFKADVAAALSGVHTVSIPGVGSWRASLDVVDRIASSRRVLLAWDWSDVSGKPEVAHQLELFAAELAERGCEVGLETWGEAYKGIDDALHNGAEVSQAWGEEALRQIRAARVRLAGLDSPVVRPVWHPSPFPVDVFPAPVKAFVEHVSALLECPVDFACVGVLLAAARALGTSRSIRLDGDWEELPNLYAVVVAPPSSAKTPALMKALRPVFRRQSDDAKRHAAEKREYLQDLKVWKAHKHGEEPREPRKIVHYWVDDVTTEAMITRLASNDELERHDPSLLYFRDEFLAVVRSLNAYRGKGADKEFFLKAWSGADVKVDRKTEDQTYIVSRPAISILGGIQPDMLREVRVEGEAADGFLDRILFSFPAEGEPYRGSDLEADRGLFLGWDAVVGRLFALRPERQDDGEHRPVACCLSPPARAAWRAWLGMIADRQKSPLFEKRLRGMYGKARAHLGRFVLLLHMLRACSADIDRERLVEESTVAAAAQLFEYFADHYAGVLRQIPIGAADRRIEDFVEWVRLEHDGRVSLRRLVRGRHFDCKGQRDAKALAESAVDRGYGVIVKDSDAKGRSREYFALVKPEEE